MYFPTKFEEIISRIKSIDPISYANNRNYIDGHVSYLSPYISRGVISLPQIAFEIKNRNLQFHEIESFVKELAWREYYQRIWNHLKNNIFADLFSDQKEVDNYGIPTQILHNNVGIQAVNKAIEELIQTGYMHNHQRMYLASILCNVGKYHWKNPSKWLYYHLLDGDLVSNALSWQWVAGTFSQKKYFANQENINKFTKSDEKGTYLDVSYEELPNIQTPEFLKESVQFAETCNLPDFKNRLIIVENSPIYVYNFYNLDPNWNKNNNPNNILLIEPSIFETYPISEKSMSFMIDLAKNIPNMQFFVGEFSELFQKVSNQPIYFKQHPLNSTYQGIEISRDWLFPEIDGYYTSFSKYWKNCLPLAKYYFSNE